MLKDLPTDTDRGKGIGIQRTLNQRSNRVGRSVSIELEYVELIRGSGERLSDVVNVALNLLFLHLGWLDKPPEPGELDDEEDADVPECH